MKKRSWPLGTIIFGLLLLVSPALAQTPQVDIFEVARWGDRVVESGSGPRDAGEVLFSMAMSTPEDDSDRWFITVWGKSKDQASLALVKSFERDAYLAPFVAEPPEIPGQPKRKPWAHLNFYQADDPTQKWRFEDFKIPLEGPFPIVTLQAPRNGSKGDPRVIIDRIDAPQIGNPAVLQKRLISSVALWSKKLQETAVNPVNVAAADKAADKIGFETLALSDAPTPGAAQAGQDAGFPWGPNPPPAVPQVHAQWPAGGPAADPTVYPPQGGGFLDFVTGSGAMKLYILLLFLLGVWEKIAPIWGFPGTVAAQIKDALVKVWPPENKPTPIMLPNLPPETIGKVFYVQGADGKFVPVNALSPSS